MENGSAVDGLRSIGSSVLKSMPGNRAAIRRRGQVVDDGVEERLHALVLERRAAQHRVEGARCTAVRTRRRSVASSGSWPSR
jgi:hypothetical protein